MFLLNLHHILTTTNRVIEYSKSYTREDKCNFTVHFHTNK